MALHARVVEQSKRKRARRLWHARKREAREARNPATAALNQRATGSSDKRRQHRTTRSETRHQKDDEPAPTNGQTVLLQAENWKHTPEHKQRPTNRMQNPEH